MGTVFEVEGETIQAVWYGAPKEYVKGMYALTRCLRVTEKTARKQKRKNPSTTLSDTEFALMHSVREGPKGRFVLDDDKLMVIVPLSCVSPKLEEKPSKVGKNIFF